MTIADTFVSGKATLGERGAATIRTLAAYLQATSGSAARIEGVDSKTSLAQQRVEALLAHLEPAPETTDDAEAAQ